MIKPILPENDVDLTDCHIVLLKITYPGNPKGCCGRNIPFSRYAVIAFDDDWQLVWWSKLYEEHLSIIAKYGPWECHYRNLNETIRGEVECQLQSCYQALTLA